MIKNIVNLGDAALYCDFGYEVNKETNSKVIRYFTTLRYKKLKGITNLSPSYNKLIITYNLSETSFENLKQEIMELKISDSLETKAKKIDVPICCDDEFSLDIKRLEKKINKSKSEIIKIFLNKSYFCYMTGFVAGMPFLGDINQNIQINRLETPRVKVPKGSVGLTEQFCNIYTFESPGGWNIIGNTPLNIFNPSNHKKPNLISPGDEVKFYEIQKNEYQKLYEK
tara:strand:- start:4982 stop:5659 length:678 start_codon:yes stop_codon:yes gene_type:complete